MTLQHEKVPFFGNRYGGLAGCLRKESVNTNQITHNYASNILNYKKK